MWRKPFKSLTTLLFALLVFVSCQKNPIELPSSVIAEKRDLDNFIIDRIKATEEPFDWADTDDDVLFKALVFSDKTLVVGYSDGINTDKALGERLLRKVYELEGKSPARLGELDETLVYKDEELGFFSVKISKLSTLKSIREEQGVSFIQPNEYVPDLKLLGIENGSSSSGNAASKVSLAGKVVDPSQPNYAQQVKNFSGSFHTKMVRHNVDQIYTKYGKFGEGIGVAILDNGLMPEKFDFFNNNGYGKRSMAGYFNPLWALANSEFDGVSPQSNDLLGLSYLIQGQWTHGSSMMEAVVLMAPNADVTTVRASPLVALLFVDGILGVVNSLKVLANDPDNRVASMSMGTIFVDNRIGNVVRLYHKNGKILNAASGTMIEGLKFILNVIYPANMPQAFAVTGIEDRTTTDGNFVIGETSTFGRRLDFCVERNQSSSEATSAMAGMVSLIWSANPSLTRAQVWDILIKSSYFYQNNNGQKHPKFGWGTVDVLQAFEMALNK